jgi:hypothetical protein
VDLEAYMITQLLDRFIFHLRIPVRGETNHMFQVAVTVLERGLGFRSYYHLYGRESLIGASTKCGVAFGRADTWIGT